ncbi:MAG: mobile mystery protein A [Halieaceae bacterium]|jgi:predicted DNA-binding mobile mystery protein A|nr:mobile mystery protein A [Halieaceae bacterium]
MKKLVQKQYQQQVSATASLRTLAQPAEGWVRTVRKSLGMSLRQLAGRMGVSTSAVARMERQEPEGRITLAQLEKAASALNCRVVYALVPEQPVEEMLAEQARRKARMRVEKVNDSMALERQQLTDQQLADQIAERTRRYLDKPPKDLWDEEPGR